MAVRLPFDSFELYRPLDVSRKEIRLLTVDAGQPDDPVHCSLQTVGLSDAMYESISYCWGDATKRGWINLNGHVANVPLSSKSAIQRMRLLDRPRVLWTDAICINQDDIRERGSQVAIVGQIYRTATGNLIHLGGQATEDTSELVELLRNTISDIEEAWVKEDRNDFLLRRIPASWKFRNVISDETIIALLPLFGFPWWDRLWVVQEAALAVENTCFWGNSVFPLDDALKQVWLRKGTSQLDLPKKFWGNPSEGGFDSAWIMSNRVWLEDRSTFSFGPHFAIARSLSTTVPRDRVFSLLQLFSLRTGVTKIPQLLTPDYEKTIGDVYRDATRYILENEPEGEALLVLEGHRAKNDMIREGRTSWTFLFGRKWDRDWDAAVFLSQSQFRAGIPRDCPDPSHTQPWIRSSISPNILSFQGFVIGEVDWSSHTMTWARLCDYRSIRSITETILVYFERSRIVFNVSEEDIHTMTATILTAGALHVDSDFLVSSNDIEQKVVEAFQAFLNHIRTSTSLPPRLVDLAPDADANMLASSTFYHRFRYQARNRRFYRLTGGRLGIGPRVLRPGDVAVASKGVSCPLILRRDGERYKLAGAAYAYGLMDGEAFDMGLPLVDIDIC